MYHAPYLTEKREVLGFLSWSFVIHLNSSFVVHYFVLQAVLLRLQHSVGYLQHEGCKVVLIRIAAMLNLSKQIIPYLGT